MKTPAQLTVLFRQRGLRVTPQRQAIFRLLQGEDTHPTVETLYEMARAELPSISRRTVYQAVHDLESLQEVRLLDLGTGSARVDPDTDPPHAHLVCERCGQVRGVGVDMPALRTSRRNLRGFSVSTVEVVFRGLCADCRTA